MFLYPRVLLSLVLGGIAAEIYWLNSDSALSGWYTAGIGLLCAGAVWLITAKLFPLIQDVATLTGSEEPEGHQVVTDSKPEEEVLTGQAEITEEPVAEDIPVLEESEPAEVYYYGVDTEDPELLPDTRKQQTSPIAEPQHHSVVETIIYESEADAVPALLDTTEVEEPVVLLMPNELSELGREMEAFRVSSYQDGKYAEIHGPEAMRVHLQRIALFYNDSSSFQYSLTRNDEILFSYLTRFYRFAKDCVESNKTCVEVKNFYSKYIEQLTEGYLQLMIEVQHEPAKEALRDVYKRARKLRKLMDRPFNKSFAA